MAEMTRSNEEPGLVGYVALLGLLLLIIFLGQKGCTAIRDWSKRPAQMSLSAYFVDSSGNPLAPTAAESAGSHLKITGKVYQDGKPVQEGRVRLTATKAGASFQQSTFVVVTQDGSFEAPDEPAFRYLREGDSILITAQVWSPQVTETTAQVSLNATSWLTSWGRITLLLTIVVLVLGVMSYAFTGRKTRWKNRVAIIFSYFTIVAFLTIPILGPVLMISAFPNLFRTMEEAPVGLVLASFGKDSLGKDKQQWALNIGGSTEPLSDSTPAEAPGRPKEKSTPALQPTGAAPQGSADKTNSAPPAPKPAASAKPQGPETPSPLEQPSNAAPASDSPAVGPKAIEPTATETAATKKAVQVRGGLVIPLYVIILSVIGGAINMTRKIPQFQEEGEYAEVELGSTAGVKMLFSRFFSFGLLRRKPKPLDEKQKPADTVPPVTEPKPAAGGEVPPAAASQPTPKADEKSLAEKAQAIDGEINQLVDQQVKREGETVDVKKRLHSLEDEMRKLFDEAKEDERILGFRSFEGWLNSRPNLKEVIEGNWRVQLLNQYMFLISAPFLAIIAYYMLDLIGKTSDSVLVLVSFSVGLISERILSSILDMASTFLKAQPEKSK